MNVIYYGGCDICVRWIKGLYFFFIDMGFYGYGYRILWCCLLMNISG